MHYVFRVAKPKIGFACFLAWLQLFGRQNYDICPWSDIVSSKIIHFLIVYPHLQVIINVNEEGEVCLSKYNEKASDSGRFHESDSETQTVKCALFAAAI